MKYLGWDPGLRYLGWGLIALGSTSSRVIAHGVLGEKLGERPWNERLDELATGIDVVLNTHLPDVMGYEDQAGVEVAMQRDGEGSNHSSRRLHEVVGMLRYAARCALDEPLPCYCLQPRSIKVALLGKGQGRAEKAQVQYAIKRLFGSDVGQHEADAIACAVATSRAHRVQRLRVQRHLKLIR